SAPRTPCSIRRAPKPLPVTHTSTVLLLPVAPCAGPAAAMLNGKRSVRRQSCRCVLPIHAGDDGVALDDRGRAGVLAAGMRLLERLQFRAGEAHSAVLRVLAALNQEIPCGAPRRAEKPGRGEAAHMLLAQLQQL